LGAHVGFFKIFGKKHTHTKPLSNRLSETGNVFMMLFGAVGMVGVIGASTMTVMKGPVKTMSQVTKRTVAENNMIAAGKLALIASAAATNSDCDTDLFLEPIEFGPAVPGFIGGGELPATIGVAQLDPWGNKYVYCAWDHGDTIDDSTCGGASQNRLQGVDAQTEYVLAVISAGPNGNFETRCNDYSGPNSVITKIGTPDDLVMGYTYSEASAMSGGLWNLADPDTAQIAKDISIKDGVGPTATETFGFDSGSGDLTIGNDLTLGTGGTGKLPFVNTDNLQSFNGAGGTINVDSALSSDSNITTSADITTTGSGALDVAGDANVGGNADVTGTLDVTGTSNLGVVNTSGAVDVGGSLDANATTVTSLDAGTGTIDGGTITGSALASTGTLSTQGNVTLGNDAADTVTISGPTTLNSSLGVTGTTNVGVLNSSSLMTLTNNVGVNPDIQFDAQGSIASESSFYLNIDSDNDSTTNSFSIRKDSDITSAGTEIFRVNEDGTVAVTGNLIMNTNSITGLALPLATNTDYAASVQYVNDRVSAGTGFSEDDPEVDTLTANKWCVANAGGTAIDCTADTPGETDPQVDALTAGKWCTTDGTKIDCTSDAPTGSDNLGNHTATTNLNLSNYKIVNLADPTNAQDAVTKSYVDALINGEPVCAGDGVNTWTENPAAEENTWESVAYGNSTYVAVASTGTNRVMTSSDGITWTAHAAAEDNNWQHVAYGNGMFVAIALNGTNRIMTSPDGATWTARAAPQQNAWRGLSFQNNQFIAMAYSGTNRMMTSPDGITWTLQNVSSSYEDIVYQDGQYVAVGSFGAIATSPDLATWTTRTAPQAGNWRSIAYGNGVYVATASSQVSYPAQMMTSTDGITWTHPTVPSGRQWRAITFANGTFVVTSGNMGESIITSTDGQTWAPQMSPNSGTYKGLVFGNDKFVAVSTNGINGGQRTMVSGEITCTTGSSGSGSGSGWEDVSLSGSDDFDIACSHRISITDSGSEEYLITPSWVTKDHLVWHPNGDSVLAIIPKTEKGFADIATEGTTYTVTNNNQDTVTKIEKNCSGGSGSGSSGSNSGSGSSLISGFPDGIVCEGTAGKTIMSLSWQNSGSGNVIYTLSGDFGEVVTTGGNIEDSPRMSFDSSGAQINLNAPSEGSTNWANWLTNCNGQSISDLEAAGQTFNYGGTSDGSSSSSTPSSDIAENLGLDGTVWPDYVRCTRSPDNLEQILQLSGLFTNGDVGYAAIISNGGTYYKTFSSSGAHVAQAGHTATCNETLAEFCADDRCIWESGEGSGSGSSGSGSGGGWTAVNSEVYNATITGNTASGSTGWIDLDLSSTVGSQETLVQLEVTTTANSTNSFAFRPKGANTLPIGTTSGSGVGAGSAGLQLAGSANRHGYVSVTTNADGIIEMSSFATQNLIVKLVGYIGGGSGSGGSGSGSGWETVTLADTNNFDTSCQYRANLDGSSGKIYMTWVTENYTLFDISSAAFKFGSISKIIFRLAVDDWHGDSLTYYRNTTNDNRLDIKFNADKTYNSAEYDNSSTSIPMVTNCNKPISQLYTDNQAFNFIGGGSGGGGGSADNLGNHTATQDLIMGGNKITLSNDTTVQPDIQFSQAGMLSAGDHFWINIDGDNDSNSNEFAVRKDSLINTGAVKLFSVNENGIVSISGITGAAAPTK